MLVIVLVSLTNESAKRYNYHHVDVLLHFERLVVLAVFIRPKHEVLLNSALGLGIKEATKSHSRKFVVKTESANEYPTQSWWPSYYSSAQGSEFSSFLFLASFRLHRYGQDHRSLADVSIKYNHSSRMLRDVPFYLARRDIRELDVSSVDRTPQPRILLSSHRTEQR